LDKVEIEDVVFSRYESRYFVPLWIAFVLIVMEILLYNKKMFRLKGFAWLKGKQLLILFALLSIGFMPKLSAQTTEEIKALREGNRIYKAA
jgi:hypothetical protein